MPSHYSVNSGVDYLRERPDLPAQIFTDIHPTADSDRCMPEVTPIPKVPASFPTLALIRVFWKAAPAIPASTSLAPTAFRRGLYLHHSFPKGNNLRR